MNSHPLKSVISQQKLYDQDFCLWIEKTIKQIESQEFDKIDWDNVIAELDSLGKSDKLSDHIIPIEIPFPVEGILNDDYLP